VSRGASLLWKSIRVRGLPPLTALRRRRIPAARRWRRTPMESAEAAALPFADASCEFATAFMSPMDMPDPAAVLREAMRVPEVADTRIAPISLIFRLRKPG
jgi:hypothetical protein